MWTSVNEDKGEERAVGLTFELAGGGIEALERRRSSAIPIALRCIRRVIEYAGVECLPTPPLPLRALPPRAW